MFILHGAPSRRWEQAVEQLVRAGNEHTKLVAARISLSARNNSKNEGVCGLGSLSCSTTWRDCGGTSAREGKGLLPDDANARARAIAWMFAALNTVEPPIVERGMAVLLERDKSWHQERLAILEDRVRARLSELSNRLGDADWLDHAFSAGDLLMVTVLRRLNGSGLLEKYPNLSAYVARGEARPAHERAFDAQLAVFTNKPPNG